MAPAPSTALTARRTPRQARATVTVDAILEATLQVLVAMGPTRMTTTRVATRAGVSVGTMYQYFPNKQALLYAVTGRYLDGAAKNLEHACLQRRGAPIGEMAAALVDVLWNANVERCDVTRAIYLVAAEVDTTPLFDRLFKRVEAATAAMFESAPDAEFADLAIVNLTLLTSLFGTVRSLFDNDLPKPWSCGLRQQLIFMCCSYLEAAKRPTCPAPTLVHGRQTHSQKD